MFTSHQTKSFYKALIKRHLNFGFHKKIKLKHNLLFNNKSSFIYLKYTTLRRKKQIQDWKQLSNPTRVTITKLLITQIFYQKI